MPTGRISLVWGPLTNRGFYSLGIINQLTGPKITGVGPE